MTVTREDLYRVRYTAQRLNLNEPSVLMCRDMRLDILKLMGGEDQLRAQDAPETLLGMPIRIDPVVPRGQVRLEDRNGLRYPVPFETPATRFQKKGPPR